MRTHEVDGVRKNVDSRSRTAVLSGRHFGDEEVGEKKLTDYHYAKAQGEGAVGTFSISLHSIFKALTHR